MLIRMTFVVAAILASMLSHAVLVDNGSYVEDSVSGLQWLKLEATRGMSSDEVELQITSGNNPLSGWRFATALEFDQLLLGQGALYQNCASGHFCNGNGPIDGISGAEGAALMQLFGEVNSGAYPYPQITALLAETDNEGHHWASHILSDSLDGLPRIWATTFFETVEFSEQALGSAYFQDVGYASWLVKTASVPIPAAAWLFGSALLVVARIKLRK